MNDSLVFSELQTRLPSGWNIINSTMPSKRVDKLFISPNGKRFSSRRDVLAYIDHENEKKNLPPPQPQTNSTREFRPRTTPIHVFLPRSSKTYPHHEPHVGSEFQAVLPVSGRQDSSLSHPLNKCTDTTLIRGCQRTSTAEHCGALVWDCDVLSEDVIDRYIERCRAITPIGKHFRAETAYQLLHEHNYDVDTAYKAMQYMLVTDTLTVDQLVNLSYHNYVSQSTEKIVSENEFTPQKEKRCEDESIVDEPSSKKLNVEQNQMNFDTLKHSLEQQVLMRIEEEARHINNPKEQFVDMTNNEILSMLDNVFTSKGENYISSLKT